MTYFSPPPRMSQSSPFLKKTFLAYLLSVLALFSTFELHAAINFTSSGLQGDSLNNPTSLQFGPDGRLYISQQDGTIFAYTVTRQGSNNYVATNVETILLVKNMLNHNDDGTVNAGLGKRQVTGILLSGTAQQPILYVSSSDPREGGPSGDLNLDTNSGVISRLTWNGNGWDKVDLVRGLPRSEENHAPNGMQLDKASNTLYVAIGGNTNAGSPSQNFASLTEYAYSGAILSIDLNAIDALPTQTDFGLSTFYKYDLPTLDDPDRSNSSGNEDINDPWGGNDGLNQAKLVVGGPVQIYASGFRNAYDFLITRLPSKEGRMYTVDNGANGGWGGHPIGEGPAVNGISSATNQYLTGEPGSTGPGTGGDAKVNNLDNLHFVTEGFYGGHPSPIRANPTGAGLYTNDTNDASQGTWRTQAAELPADWPPVPPSMVNPLEGDYLQPGVDDNALATFASSTNGIAEYTASNFGGELQGDLVLASFSGNLERIQLNAAGTEATNVSTFASNFGSLPLDVVAQGDDEPFPGTIWAATYGSNNISIFEPTDYDGGNDFVCNGVYDFNIDEDGDGYSNAEEIDNGSNPCSASDVPADFDQDIISDLFDPDDDNDGIIDTQDPYPQDKYNGRSTSIPLDYPMLNGDPGTGFYGLGFTGLMSNGTDDYLALLKDELLIPGGTSGVLTIDGVTQTSAFESQNDQENALQFGIDVNSTSGAFLIHVRMAGDVFGSIIPTDGRSIGAYIGTGDQDNYLMFAAVATSSGPELTLVHENNAVAETLTPLPNITSLTQLVNLNLFFLVDPGLGTVQPQYSIDGGSVTNLGAPIPLSGNLLSTLQGTDALAVGVIASATNSDADFTAQWDFINVTPLPTEALGTWANLAPAQPASPNFSRMEHAYVKAGNKFYMIGGGGGSAYPVKIYDPLTNLWTTGATAPVDFHHFQAVELNGLIYVIGAEQASYTAGNLVDNIYIYNPINDSWTTGPEIPPSRNRWSAGAIAHKGKIYVVAGIVGSQSTSGIEVPWFDEFDPATGTWTQLEDAPRGRDHTQAAIINNKLYVAGGRNSNAGAGVEDAVVLPVDMYDFQTNTWTTLPNNIPTGRGGCFVAAYNGELLVMGGERTYGALNVVEALNPQTNTWRTLAPMNVGRHATQAIVANGAIYIAAGAKNKGVAPIDSSEAFFQEIYQVNGILTPTQDPLDPGTLTATPTLLSFSTSLGLFPQSANVILSNAGGDQAITVTDITISGYAGIALNNTSSLPAIIAPNQTMTFEVIFDSNFPGQKTGDIYIQHEGANDDLIIPINGGSGDEPLALYRVNAGGGSLIGSKGLNWEEDLSSAPSIYVNSSETNNTTTVIETVTPNASVPIDTPSALFESDRWDGSAAPEMQWNFPVSNGSYEVRLYFAENYSVAGSPGNRVFDVAIEDIIVLNDYDVFADAGALFVGVMKNFVAEVSDGQLTIDFIHVVENPSIKGIEIIDLNAGTGGPVNNTPTIASISELTNINEDVVSLSVEASDIDGDTLNYSATGLPAGLSIDAFSGLISGTIGSGADTDSPYSVMVTVTDDGNPQAAASTSFIWNINSFNSAPNILPVSDKFNTVGDAVNLQVFAADIDIGDSLSYSATNLPDGLIIEPTTGQILGTLAIGADSTTPYSVTVIVTDDSSQPESAQISFNWTINSEGGEPTNNSPAINFIGAQTHTVEDAVSLQVFGSDPDVGDILTYSATGLPDGLSIDNASGLIAGTIATGADTSSPYAVLATVTDDGNPIKSAATSFSWNVDALPPKVRILYRVNSGGSQLNPIDSEPVDWSGDTKSSPSSYVNSSQTNNTYATGSSVTAGPSVPSEVPLALFQSERYDTSSSPEMQWNFPVSNGNYEVRLYFAEIFSGTGSPGERVFDVVIEDILALDDYDVVADAGAMFVGVMQNFEVEVTDELLTIDLLHVIENPAIKGIEIIDLNDDTGGPINTAPTITSISEQSNINGDVVNLTISAADIDPGDALTFTASGLPAGLTIDASSGVISGTIATLPEASSPYAVIVTVTDDGQPNKSAEALFSWNVSAFNNAPTITSISEQFNINGDVVNLTVSAADIDPGDALTFTASGLPAGLTIDASSGVISGTIATLPEASSPYAVIVTVTDDGQPNKSAEALFSWNVSAFNNAPTITSISEQSNINGDVVNLTISAADIDPGDALTFTASGLPAGLTIDASSGVISGTIATLPEASSPYAVIVTVTDDGQPNKSAEALFSWNVSAEGPINNAPTITPIPDQTSVGCACDCEWQTIDDSTGTPTARHEAAYVAVNGEFYLIGGRGTRPLDIYDPATNAWRVGASPPIELHHFQAIVYDNEIWVVGALTGNYPNGTPVEQAYIYNPANNAWRLGPTIDRPRGGGGAFVREGKIYLVCGLTIGHIGGHVSWFDCYDPSTGSWTQLPDAPRARDHFAAQIVNEKLWLASGRRTAANDPGGLGANMVAEIDFFDFNIGSWTTLPAELNLPTPRAGTATASIGNQLIVAGGESGSQSIAHDEVQALDTVNLSWRELSPLKDGRHGTSIVAGEGGLYIVAGSGSFGGSPELTSQEFYAFCEEDAANYVSLQVFASDIDGDALGYSASNLPSGLSISPITGLITGTVASDALPSSPYEVTVTVTDDGSPNKSAEPIDWSGDTKSSPSTYVNSSQTNSTYTTGSSVTAGPSVPSEVPLALFQSERYDTSSSPEMQWNFPVSNGNYEVRLYFAENYSGTGSPGQRVFDVALEGAIALDDYDVVADAGAMFVGVMKIVQVTVTDELLTIDLLHVIENPAIKGIEIIALNGTGGPINNAPTITSIQEQTNTVVDTVSLQVLASDADAGDTLSYSATGLPAGLSINTSSGLISGDIASGADTSSPYTVLVTVTDNGSPNESANVSFTWNVYLPNNAPAVDSVDNQTNTVADSVSLQVLASDTDGDTLTYSATGLPDGLFINTSSGLISGDIASEADTSSPYSVTVTVTDNGIPNESANTSFTWSVDGINNAPSILPVSDKFNTVGDVVSLQMNAADLDLEDTLSYSAANLPAGLSIDPSSGLISGVIAAGADTSSPYTVLVTVTDNGSPQESANTSFAWTVNAEGPSNNAPTLTPIASQTNTVADSVSLQVIANDADGDALSYSAPNLPDGLSISSSGLITGIIATNAELNSPYEITVTVTDNGEPNKSAETVFVWNVDALPPEAQVLYRVNSGGSPLPSIDSEPINWSGDTKSSPSSYVNSSQTNNTYATGSSVTAGPSVPSEVPLALFQSERYDTSSSPEMQWNFPVSNGNYEVRLYFAENYSGTGSPGERVFDVVIEDILALDDYDVVADAGAMFVGVMQSFEVEVTDELLTIDLLHVIENPAIKGIEIIDITGPTPNELGSSTSQIDFGGIAIDASGLRTFQLINKGASGDPSITIDPSALTISGPDSSKFGVSFASSGPITLEPGNSTTVTVTFQPTTEGLYSAILNIPHSGNNTPLEIVLAGQGEAFVDFNWTVGTPSPIARVEAGGAVINDKIYVFGGFTNTSMEASLQSHVYDPSTDVWTRLADMPAKITHSMCAVDGNIVWFVAGFDGNDPGIAVDNVYKYNIDTDSWSQGPNLPASRGGGGTAIVGRELHYFGGYSADRKTNNADHWVLDLDNPTSWTTAADLPSPRGHFGVAVFNGKIYAVGGQFGHDGANSESDLMHVYDPATNTWTQAPSLPFPRSHHEAGTIVHEDHIIVVGGQSAVSTSINDISAYDLATETWKTLPTLPNNIIGSVAAIINNQLYVTTGSLNGETNPQATTYVAPWSSSALDAASPGSLSAAASSPQLVEQGLPDDSPSSPTQFSNYVMQIFATDSYDLEIKYNSSQAETVSWELLNTGETGSFVTTGSGVSELQYIYDLTIPEGLQMLQLSYADSFSLEYIDALLSEPSSFSGYLSDTDAVTGNFQLLANVQELVSSGARPEVGIIIEEPSSGTSRFVQLGIQLDQNYYARASTDASGSVEELNTGASGSFPNAWILLERTGDQVSVAVSSDNVSYQLIQVITLPSLPDTLDAGLYIDSGSENIDAKATLQNFEIIPLP